MKKMNKLSLLGAVSAWVLGAGVMQAQAVCVENPADVWTCDGLVDNVGIVDLNPNVTVTVTANGSIVTLTDGIFLSNLVGTYSVTNAGVIIANGGDDGIDVNNSDAFSLLNTGTITADDDGLEITNVDSVTIDNSGSILGDANQLVGGNGILIVDATSISILNQATGSISSLSDGDRAVFVDDLTDVQDIITMDNFGTIQGDGEAIYLWDIDDVTINNSGLILGDADANNGALGNAIHIERFFDTFALDATVTNFVGGTIQSLSDAGGNAILVENTGALSLNDIFVLNNAGDILSNSFAVTVNDIANVTVLNSGNIIGNEDDDAAGFDALTIQGSLSNVKIENFVGGLIWGKQADAILVQDNSVTDLDVATIFNAGTIQSEDDGIIVLNIESVSITNEGKILGDLDNSGAGTAIGVLNALTTIITNNEGGLIASAGNQALDGAIVVVSFLAQAESVTIGNAEGAEIYGDNAGILTVGIDRVAITNAGSLHATSEAIITFNSLNVNIDNEATGVISTDTNFGDVVIDLGAGVGDVSTDRVRNAGIINGRVLLNAGDDHMTFVTGMGMNGYVDGGAGIDDVFFTDEGVGEGDFDINKLDNFEFGQVVDGYWRLSSLVDPEPNGQNQFSLFTVGDIAPGVNDNPVLAVHGNDDIEFATLSLFAGNYVQHANGTLAVDVNGAVDGESDLLDIISPAQSFANLGGTLDVNLKNQLELKVADGLNSYTVLRVDTIDPIDNQFADVTPVWKSAVIDRDVIYHYVAADKDFVEVTFQRKPYEDAQDSLGNGLRYHNDISWAAYQTNVLENSLYAGHDDISTYLKNLDYTNGLDGLGPYIDKLRAANGELYDVFNQMVLTSNEAVREAIGDHLNTRDAGCSEQERATLTCESEKIQGWLTVRHEDGELDSFNEHGDYDVDVLSVIGGVDIAINEALVVGGALSYHDADANADTDGSALTGVSDADADGQSWGFEAYLQHSGLFGDNSYVRASVGYQHAYDLDLDRDMIIADTSLNEGLARSFDGNTDANSWNANVEAGWKLRAGSLDITPYLGMSYTHVDVDDLTEDSTSDMALDVDFDNVSEVKGELGARIGSSIEAGAAMISWNVNPYVTHEFSGSERDLETRYAVISDAPFSADIESNDGAQTQLGIAGSVNASFGNFTVGAKVDYAAGDDADQLTLSGTAGFKF